MDLSYLKNCQVSQWVQLFEKLSRWSLCIKMTDEPKASWAVRTMNVSSDLIWQAFLVCFLLLFLTSQCAPSSRSGAADSPV